MGTLYAMPLRLLKGRPVGKVCEELKMNEYTMKGCRVLPTGRGSDFLAICPTEKPKLVEVKFCRGGLTPFQRKTRDIAEKSGIPYVVERCGCKIQRSRERLAV
jgi:hypothetical protein